MTSSRILIMIALGMWLLSIPLLLLNLDEYHTIHEETIHIENKGCSCDCSNVATNDQFENSIDKKLDTDNFVLTHKDRYNVWPIYNETDDRVFQQLQLNQTDGKQIKLILLWSYFGTLPKKDQIFIDGNCPVKECQITTVKPRLTEADLVLGHERDLDTYFGKKDRVVPHNQIVVWHELESPLNAQNIKKHTDQINWTATYRTDSTIATPYYKFNFFENVTSFPTKPIRNYAEGKSKMAAVFISNCESKNGRLNYIRQLKKYISVDVYGYCGRLKCSVKNDKQCQEMLNKEYKFYLAFENSNCKDYITEKFFHKGLSNDIIPVVMGARPEDYAAVAPPHSYIHVDDFESPRHLASYLEILNQNDTLYNEYFLWKGLGDFIDTKFWCRMCSMIHEAHSTGVRTWFKDVNEWWRGDGVCIKPVRYGWATWRGIERHYDYTGETVWHLA